MRQWPQIRPARPAGLAGVTVRLAGVTVRLAIAQAVTVRHQTVLSWPLSTAAQGARRPLTAWEGPSSGL